MMWLRAGAFALAALSLSASNCDVPPDTDFLPLNYYSSFANGPPNEPTFFPIAVWDQAPQLRGHSGAFPTIAEAARAEGINIFLGLWHWPERYGEDNGELQTAQASGEFVIAGGDPSNATSAQSIGSVLALAKSVGAGRQIIGFQLGDEPNCAGSLAIPSQISALKKQDSSRLLTWNQAPWVPWADAVPGYSGCIAAKRAALRAADVGSFDLYPVTNPWFQRSPYAGAASHVRPSDFLTVAQDNLWLQGLATAQAVAIEGVAKPVWAFVESGADNLGQSGGNARFLAETTNGSAVLANKSGFSSFTPAWLGLTVSGPGLPEDTKITGIVDPTHATLSKQATSTLTSKITASGGAHGDCVARYNICVVNGNEYRATPAQVSSEVWETLINGAVGIEWFCHDAKSDSFCLGDKAAGDAASTSAANITYVDGVISRFARQLSAPAAGRCSMQRFDLSIATVCRDGLLSMATASESVPGASMVKAQGGKMWLFAMSDRASDTGAAFSFKLEGQEGKVAQVVYDSDERYDRVHSSLADRIKIDQQGRFRDWLGAHDDHYQVKIYRIE